MVIALSITDSYFFKKREARVDLIPLRIITEADMEGILGRLGPEDRHKILLEVNCQLCSARQVVPEPCAPPVRSGCHLAQGLLVLQGWRPE